MSTESNVTPAQELRAAASKIRNSAEPTITCHGMDISQQVAIWLDLWAELFERDLAMPRRSDIFIDADDVTELARPALNMARAINGEVSA